MNKNQAPEKRTQPVELFDDSKLLLGARFWGASGRAMIQKNSRLATQMRFSSVAVFIFGLASLVLSAIAQTGTHPRDCSTLVGLVAWYRAEGNAQDAIGGNNGALYNGVAFAAGILGQAFLFDGKDDAGSIPDSPTFQFTGSFTIQAWIYANAYPGAQNDFGWGKIFFRGDDRVGYDPVFLSVQTDGSLHFQIASANNVPKTIMSRVPLKKWFQITATFDADVGRMSLFTNGQPAVSTTTPIRPLVNLVSNLPGGVAIGNHAVVPFTPPQARAILTSTDAIHWTVRDLSLNQPTLWKVLFEQERFVAVGNLGTVMNSDNSDDGRNWKSSRT